MSSVVVGATAGVGRALAELLAANGEDLVLMASDARDLTALASHIRTVHQRRVDTLVVDAAQPHDALEALDRLLVDRTPDHLFFPIGASRSDDQGELGAAEASMLISINLTTVIAIVARFLPRFVARNSGSIVGFGSVASVRGRSSNMVYAAAKRGLESYFESLRHITARTQIEVSLYRLGYVDSQQSYGQRLIFPKVSPQAVAREVVADLGRGGGFRSFPSYWRLIALAVALVPWPIFKRLRF